VAENRENEKSFEEIKTNVSNKLKTAIAKDTSLITKLLKLDENDPRAAKIENQLKNDFDHFLKWLLDPEALDADLKPPEKGKPPATYEPLMNSYAQTSEYRYRGPRYIRYDILDADLLPSGLTPQ